MRRLIDFTTFYTNRTVFDKPYKILWISLQLVSYRTICEATAIGIGINDAASSYLLMFKKGTKC